MVIWVKDWVARPSFVPSNPVLSHCIVSIYSTRAWDVSFVLFSSLTIFELGFVSLTTSICRGTNQYLGCTGT